MEHASADCLLLQSFRMASGVPLGDRTTSCVLGMVPCRAAMALKGTCQIYRMVKDQNQLPSDLVPSAFCSPSDLPGPD